jgi:hypothetical protein
MPFKQNTSSSLTASERVDQDGVIRQSVSRSTTTTRRKMTRGETAGGLLTTIGQINMIGITIVVLVVTVPLSQFNKADLISFMPNYVTTNEYVDVDDPLTHYNYSQFGEGIFESIYNWIIPMEQLGTQFYGFWTGLMDLVTLNLDALSENTLGAFATQFGGERQYELYQISRNSAQKNAAVFNALTNTERDWLVDNSLTVSGEKALFDFTRFYLFYNDFYDLFGGGLKWWFTEPSVIDICIQEGYGT